MAGQDCRSYLEVVGGVDGVVGGAGAVADAVEDFGGHQGAVEEGCVGCWCCHSGGLCWCLSLWLGVAIVTVDGGSGSGTKLTYLDFVVGENV